MANKSTTVLGVAIAVALLAAAVSLAPAITAAQAQEVKTIQLGQGGGGAFSFHGVTNGRLRTFASDDEAQGVVRRVLSAMGLPLRLEVRAAAMTMPHIPMFGMHALQPPCLVPSTATGRGGCSRTSVF